MRWFRCILSREFSIDIAINLWDFIFSGVKDSHRVDKDFGDMYYIEGYSDSLDDPLINLDYLWLAMIENIRVNLYKQDLGSWLEVFYNYPEVFGASKLISMAGKVEKSVSTNIQYGLELVKKTASTDSTIEESKELESIKDSKENEQIKEEQPKREAVKEKKPKFYDPLSDPLLNKRAIQNSIQSINKTKEGDWFPAKRIAERKRSESIEELDNSPKATNSNSLHDHSKSTGLSKEFISNPLQEKRKNKFEDEDNNSNIKQNSKTINQNAQESSAKNILNYLNDGFNLIKETKKQYVDPLVKTGVDKMTSKWAHPEENTDSIEEKQNVLREKLTKIKAFLEDLKEGTHVERDHQVYINVDIDESKIQDMETEIETMIQMTYN